MEKESEVVLQNHSNNDIQDLKCNNCNANLNPGDTFCSNCGEKVKYERVTLKYLFSNFVHSFGWDSKILTTLRYLLYQPQIVIKEYLSGSRRKFSNPFTIFAINLTIAVFVFNQFSEQIIEKSLSHMPEQIIQQMKENKYETKNKQVKVFGYKNQFEFQKELTKFQIKYFNIFTYLNLPFYALIALWVFGKPYNYAEHLIISTYLQSIIILFGVILNLITLSTGINIVWYSMIFPIFYYLFTYKKLYDYSLKELFIKFLKFLGIAIGLFVLLIIFSSLIGLLLYVMGLTFK